MSARGFGTTFGVATTDRITTTLGTAETGDITYAIWNNRNGDGGSGLGRLWEKRVAGSQSTNFYNSSGTSRYGYRQDSNGGASSAVYEIARPSTGIWHHMAVTCNITALLTPVDPLMYSNGFRVTPTLISNATVSLVTNTDAYVIGNRGDGLRNWDGLLAEFAVWRRILTPWEIAGLGDGRRSPLFYPAGLILYCPGVMLTDVANGPPTLTGTRAALGPGIVYPRSGLGWRRAA